MSVTCHVSGIASVQAALAQLPASVTAGVKVSGESVTLRRTDVVVRFYSKVDTRSGYFWNGTECWDWKASFGSSGYGQLYFQGRVRPAHVVGFWLAHGRFPEPFGLHRCDRRCCVNPAHIFEGDYLVNNRDAQTKGRAGWMVAKDTWGSWAAGRNHWSQRNPDAVLKGSQNPRAKLKERDVRVIRRKTLQGASRASLAREYGVSEVAVFNIVTRRSWRHI